jgi:hypothetical protein
MTTKCVVVISQIIMKIKSKFSLMNNKKSELIFVQFEDFLMSITSADERSHIFKFFFLLDTYLID